MKTNKSTLFLTTLYLLICFVHSLLRNMKDSMIVTAPGAGAEALPFIQVWMMVPIALVATYCFSKLSTHVSHERLFYTVIGCFILFFLLFGVVLFPFRDALHWHDTADTLMGILPLGLRGAVTMTRYWSFSLFYTVSELWSCMVTSVLFWGIANQITQLDKVKHTYGLYAIGGNIGAILAGLSGQWMSGWSIEQTVYLLVTIVILVSIGMIALFRWMVQCYLASAERATLCGTFKQKTALTLTQAIRELFQSRYLLSLATIVLAYNLVLGLGELVYKDQLRRLCPNFSDYNAYLGMATIAIGCSSVLLCILLPRIITFMGWRRTALITPVLMATAAMCFLLLLHFGERLPYDQTTVLSWIVLSGALMDTIGRISKHTVFDSTKDMAFITLPSDVRLRGKAAVDGAISRLGRSGSAATHQLLIIAFSGIMLSVPVVAVLIAIACVVWIRTVNWMDSGWQPRASIPPKLP